MSRYPIDAEVVQWLSTRGVRYTAAIASSLGYEQGRILKAMRRLAIVGHVRPVGEDWLGIRWEATNAP